MDLSDIIEFCCEVLNEVPDEELPFNMAQVEIASALLIVITIKLLHNLIT
jgi:hypothetical protein